MAVLLGAQVPQRAGAQAGAKIYLPFVAGATIAPQLQAPAKGAMLTTLAPLLSFTPLITGTHRIEISTTHTFTTTVFSTTLNLRDAALPPVTRPVNSNLDDSMRFYWRVEVIQASTIVFSEARIFVTPAKSTTPLPAKPILDAPPDGATVPTSTLTLSWKPVAGAIYYRVTVNRADGSEFTSALIDGKTTMLDLVNVPAGLSLNWKVKVLTASGWSSFAGPRGFKTNTIQIGASSAVREYDHEYTNGSGVEHSRIRAAFVDGSAGGATSRAAKRDSSLPGRLGAREVAAGMSAAAFLA